MAEPTYKAGSEGSRICSENIRKDYNPGTLSEHAPAETDHPIAPPDHALRVSAANEPLRRKANRKRDNSRRWGVVNDAEGTFNRESPAK